VGVLRREYFERAEGRDEEDGEFADISSIE
jgi:hypothetical protein